MNNILSTSVRHKIKTILTFILLLLFSCLFFFVAYLGYEDQHIDLKALRSFTGPVSDYGEAVRKSGKNRPLVFYVDLKGLEQRLGVYRMSKEYGSIINQLNIGDTLTVYYKEQSPCDINIDLVQMERGNTILIDKSEYMKKESALIWIGLIGAALSLLLNYGFYKSRVQVLFKRDRKFKR